MVIVLPYLLGVVSVLPAGAADWVLRITPAAAFAVQQAMPQYAQVTALYSPGGAGGYFPLAPWAGFAVLCGWAAVAWPGLLLRRPESCCGRQGRDERGRPAERCTRSGPSRAP